MPSSRSPMLTDKPTLPVAALVLTYNEEANIGKCLSSLTGWCREVHVVDSGSTDRTLEICESHGARIHFHPFVDSATQWDWALQNVSIEPEWIFLLDADHEVTPRLWEEMATVLASDVSDVEGYYSRHRYFFWGQPMRGFKPYGLRLVRKGCARVDLSEMVDMRFLVKGNTARLAGFVNESNAKELSLDFWIDKHQKFASRMAVEEVLRQHGELQWAVTPRLSGNPDESIVWFKNHWYKLPLFIRPILYFIYRYFFRLGLLDGRSGLVFHFFHAFWFRFLIDAHIYRLRHDLTKGTVKFDALAASMRSPLRAQEPPGDKASTSG